MSLLFKVFALLSFALMATASIITPTSNQNFVNGATITVFAQLTSDASAANVTLSNGISYTLTIPATVESGDPTTVSASFIAPLGVTGAFTVTIVSDEGDNITVVINIVGNSAYCGYFPRRLRCCGASDVEGEDSEDGVIESVSDFVEEAAQLDANIESPVA